MNIIILGPQGSGKGTQAKLIADKFNLFYFESGEFLRELAIKNEVVRAIMDKGELVPSNELASYIESFLDEKEIYDNIIFDGFPREVEQYKFFKDWLTEKKVNIDFSLLLNVSKETTMQRLLLRKREDDTPEAIEKRLELYRNETLPLIEELRKDSKLIEIDGERTVEEIQKEICEKLI
ncbi:adenylate kinase [soil metagenome]